MKNKFKPNKLYEIFWEDACSPADGGWLSMEFLEKLNGPAEIKTSGYVVAESKKTVTLSGTLGESAFNGAMTIPKVCITKVRKLK